MAEILTLPGYMTEFTDRGAKGRYVTGDNVRFRNKLPQKIGGAQPRVGSSFAGKCRKMHPFKSNDLKPYIALATHVRFYIDDQGSTVNVTPIRDTGSLSGPFSSTAASTLITVADAGHGVEVGDYVNFSGASASPIDGLDLNSTYVVVSVPNANSYTFNHTVTATNSESGFGGASVTYSYEINVGQADASVGAGWGGGTWGTGTWGTPRTGSGILTQLRTVALDSWGEDVIWTIRSGKTYVFDTSAGISSSNRATVISGAPVTAEFMLVSPEDRHLILYGAHDGSASDKMLIRWSDDEDYTAFTPAVTNTAGDKRLDKGTRIMTAIYTKNLILILTDIAAYSQVFIGYPNIYAIRNIADKCGAMSPNSGIAYNDIVMWMANNKNFYIYDGSVRRIPCEVRNHIFKDFNYTQKDKVQCSLQTEHDECWWLYCSANSTEIDRWVVYNYADDYFFFGTYDDWSCARTAMVDAGEVTATPVAAGTDGRLHDHETGYDDGTTPLPTYLRRFYDEINDGKKFTGVSRLIPDFRTIVGAVNMTLLGKKFPQSSELITRGPKQITSATTKKSFRIRARQVSVVIESSALGDYWEFGTLRTDDFELGQK